MVNETYLLSFPFKSITLPLCFYFLSVTVFETDLQLTNRCIYIDIFVYIERLVLVETTRSTANHKCPSIPLKELRSGHNLDSLSWQEKYRANIILVHTHTHTHIHNLPFQFVLSSLRFFFFPFHIALSNSMKEKCIFRIKRKFDLAATL